MKITEEVIATVPIRITYEKKKGARENAIEQIRLGVSVFGYSGKHGGYEVKSLSEQMTIK